MELQTISQVSKAYGVTTRMMRYYEQIGLLQSQTKDDYSYRVYDEDALQRLQQIILLRKLQIPVKKIAVILGNPEVAAVINIFKENIAQMEAEISALSTIKTILETFVDEIEKLTAIHMNLDLLSESSVQKLATSLSLVQKNIKERFSMNELDRAANVLNKLSDVRVVYVPPMTLATYHYIGEKGDDFSEEAYKVINEFVASNNLTQIKPDLRCFGFDRATAKKPGYEAWVSIPNDMAVPEPLVRKVFHGGLYAAHSRKEKMDTTLGLQDWINESPQYQVDWNLDRYEPRQENVLRFLAMGMEIEEVLNYYNFQTSNFEREFDYLIPIKQYEALPETAPQKLLGIEEKCGFKASIVSKNKFKIIGFTKIMTHGENAGELMDELKNECLDVINKYRKPNVPILAFGSHDMNSELNGGWRYTICLVENDITNVQALMKHNPYVEAIDASQWLIFEHEKGAKFDGHKACIKAGYMWNNIISGSFEVFPNDTISNSDMNSTVYCWYPVKYKLEEN